MVSPYSRNQRGSRNTNYRGPQLVTVVGDLAYIEIESRTHGKKQVIFDAADAPLVGEKRWCLAGHPEANTFYAKSCDSTFVLMHRLILGFPDSHVDHRDCDGLNNRRLNLRKATESQNSWNRPKYKTNKSGHKGVSWHTRANKWAAYICRNGRQKYLGVFETVEAAAIAYLNADAEMSGEFAHLHNARARRDALLVELLERGS